MREAVMESRLSLPGLQSVGMPPQLLTSSSAKADDPVLCAAQDFMRAGDYWIPAFAGMTAVLVGRASRFSPIRKKRSHPHRHPHVERAFGIPVLHQRRRGGLRQSQPRYLALDLSRDIQQITRIESGNDRLGAVIELTH